MWMWSLTTGIPCGGEAGASSIPRAWEPGDRGGRASPRGQDASNMTALTLAREKRPGGEKQPQG
jgi:hypothetical protein